MTDISKRVLEILDSFAVSLKQGERITLAAKIDGMVNHYTRSSYDEGYEDGKSLFENLRDSRDQD